MSADGASRRDIRVADDRDLYRNVTSQRHAIVTACDTRYVPQLATALRSIVESGFADELPPVYILSEGIADGLRQSVERSLDPYKPDVHWIDLDLSGFRDMSTLRHVSRATYARLLLPDAVPTDRSRVLYLDLDLLVLRSLRPLLETDLEGCAVGAVRDSLIDARLRQNDRSAIGVPRVQRYFNAGVLVVDVPRWKETGITEAALTYLADHPTSPYSDQDALNFACDGCWKELDARWNFQEHLYVRPGLDSDQRPWIVHFVTEAKPWIARMRSPYAGLYDKIRSRTLFARGRMRRFADWTIGTLAASARRARRALSSGHLRRDG